MLCAITMMCYLLLPMQLVPLQECIKLNFSKILSSLFEIFLEKKIIKRKKLCKTLFWKKIQWTQWYLLWKFISTYCQEMIKSNMAWPSFSTQRPLLYKKCVYSNLVNAWKKESEKKINQNPSSICWKKCSSMYVVLRIF